MPTVRSAAVADAAAWSALRHELWPEDDAAILAEEVRRYFAGELDNPLEVLLAFDDTGRALGFAELSIRNYAEGCATDRVAYLEGWYVVAGRRRTGVGRALIAAAEAWGLAQGCSEFGSDALIDNDVSAAAHKALGFAEVERIRCFRKPLVPRAPGS